MKTRTKLFIAFNFSFALSVLLALVASNGGVWSTASFSGDKLKFGLRQVKVTLSDGSTDTESYPVSDRFGDGADKLNSGGLLTSAFIGIGTIFAAVTIILVYLIQFGSGEFLHKWLYLAVFMHFVSYTIMWAGWVGVAQDGIESNKTFGSDSELGWCFALAVVSWIAVIFSSVTALWFKNEANSVVQYRDVDTLTGQTAALVDDDTTQYMPPDPYDAT